MANHQALYLGRSGQFAVMSELLYRGLNVAIPEVDVGDDVFVVRDTDDSVTRVQVKTASAVEQLRSCVAQFRLSLKQLERPDKPPLVYVFCVRRKKKWAEFVVISRSALNRLRAGSEVGAIDPQGYLVLRLKFTDDDVICRETSLQEFRDAWEPWPP